MHLSRAPRESSKIRVSSFVIMILRTSDGGTMLSSQTVLHKEVFAKQYNNNRDFRSSMTEGRL